MIPGDRRLKEAKGVYVFVTSFQITSEEQKFQQQEYDHQVTLQEVCRIDCWKVTKDTTSISLSNRTPSFEASSFWKSAGKTLFSCMDYDLWRGVGVYFTAA